VWPHKAWCGTLLLFLLACSAPAADVLPTTTPTSTSISAAPALQPLPTPTSTLRSGVLVIEAADQYFNPPEVTVAVGTTVIWKDVQGTHNMVADDQSFASEVLIEGESYAHVFSAPGQYRYICTLHVGAGMWAEIDVK
jgi:plastocyanin